MVRATRITCGHETCFPWGRYQSTRWRYGSVASSFVHFRTREATRPTRPLPRKASARQPGTTVPRAGPRQKNSLLVTQSRQKPLMRRMAQPFEGDKGVGQPGGFVPCDYTEALRGVKKFPVLSQSRGRRESGGEGRAKRKRQGAGVGGRGPHSALCPRAEGEDRDPLRVQACAPYAGEEAKISRRGTENADRT